MAMPRMISLISQFWRARHGRLRLKRRDDARRGRMPTASQAKAIAMLRMNMPLPRRRRPGVQQGGVRHVLGPCGALTLEDASIRLYRRPTEKSIELAFREWGQ